MVSDRRAEFEHMAGGGPGRAPRRRGSISRPIGLALMRAGRRLAGPDELRDRRLGSLVFTEARRR
jgi:hypothetical protein